MDDSIISSEADPASPPEAAAMDTSEANEDSYGDDAMIRNDTDPNLCSPEQLGEIEINNDFDDLHQEVDLDMADDEVNGITEGGIPDDVDNDSPSSGAAIEEAVNAALPFSKPPSRDSSRASSKTRSEGGGSQPERPDSPIDIEIPFVAESEESIADKELRIKHGLNRFAKVQCGERLAIPEKCQLGSVPETKLKCAARLLPLQFSH